MPPTIAAGLREKDNSATAVGHSTAVSSGSRVNYRLFMSVLSPQMSSSKLVCLKSSQLSTESSQLSRKSRLLFAGNGELLAKRSVTNQRAPQPFLLRRVETCQCPDVLMPRTRPDSAPFIGTSHRTSRKHHNSSSKKSLHAHRKTFSAALATFLHPSRLRLYYLILRSLASCKKFVSLPKQQTYYSLIFPL